MGARIVLDAAGTEYLREVTLGSNFASQNPTAQLIGLGAASLVDRLSVHWPDGEETSLQAVAVNQYLDIEHPRYDPDENVGTRLVVVQGDGSGFYGIGDEVAIRAAEPDAGYQLSHWEVTGGEVAAPSSRETVVTLLERVVRVTARYLPGVDAVRDASVARRWNEVLLQSIRNDFHSRIAATRLAGLSTLCPRRRIPDIEEARWAKGGQPHDDVAKAAAGSSSARRSPPGPYLASFRGPCQTDSVPSAWRRTFTRAMIGVELSKTRAYGVAHTAV